MKDRVFASKLFETIAGTLFNLVFMQAHSLEAILSLNLEQTQKIRFFQIFGFFVQFPL